MKYIIEATSNLINIRELKKLSEPIALVKAIFIKHNSRKLLPTYLIISGLLSLNFISLYRTNVSPMIIKIKNEITIFSILEIKILNSKLLLIIEYMLTNMLIADTNIN